MAAAQNQWDGSTSSATYSAVLRWGKQTDVNVDVTILRYICWWNTTHDASLMLFIYYKQRNG